MKRIITIGREFGSGGRELGKRIAEALGIAYYDKEIIDKVASNTKLAIDYVQQIIEKKPLTYYPITIGNSFNGIDDVLARSNATIYAEQAKVIKELADKSDCVIVGRCADYILKDYKPFRIFVYSDMDSKIKRCIEKGEVEDKGSAKKIKKEIKKVDKHRRHYYEFYTSQKWGDIHNYDVCINTSGRTIKEVVKDILTIFKEGEE